MKHDIAALIERLSRKAQLMPPMGGGSVTLGKPGEAPVVTSYITDDGKRLVNPDGPEAATALTALSARVEALEAEADRQESLAKVYRQAQLTAEEKLCRKTASEQGWRKRAEYLEAKLKALGDPVVSDGWTERGKEWLAAGAPLGAEFEQFSRADDPGVKMPPERQETELALLYNHRDSDEPQFTSWQMKTAIAHGYRLGTDEARAALRSPAPSTEEVEKDAIAAAYIAGATAVHEHWQANPGEAPRGDPEFYEAASDYATALSSLPSTRIENPCAKIFDHKWLDPECVETGCRSLMPRRLAEEIAAMEPPEDPHTDAWLLGFCRARKMAAEHIRQALDDQREQGNG